MSDPVADGARAAASRLAPQHGTRLPTDVEAALHSRSAQTRRDQYFDPISLGSLIVSIATLTWNIYKDRKSQDATPPTEVIIRAVRIELDNTGQFDPAQHDPIIQTTVERTLDAARHQDED